MARFRVVSVFAVLVVAAVATVAIVPMGAGAVPDTDCAGSGGGAIFVADSGFTVEYNDSQPMPANGPFRGDDTMRFQNVNLSSAGDTFLRLEDGTGPETCLGAVNASLAPIEVDPDDEQAVVIKGEVDALSLADASYGSGSVDFAYEAGSSWTLTIPSTGIPGDIDIVAEDSGQTVLASGTVDSSGELVLSLPAGTYDVDLKEPTSQISVTSASTATSEVTVGESLAVTAELQNDGDASGQYTATLTANGQAVADQTVTVPANTAQTATLTTSFSQAGSYSLSVDGQDAGIVTVSKPTAQVSIAAVSTQTSQVRTAEAVDVTVELRNDGDTSGEYTATLTADGQAVKDQTVTVPANTVETITLTTTFSQAGSYSLSVDGQYVSEVTVTDDQSGDTTDDSGSEQGSGPPWLIILGIVALLAGVGGYAMARRDQGDSA
jgi:hypothetical protein